MSNSRTVNSRQRGNINAGGNSNMANGIKILNENLYFNDSAFQIHPVTLSFRKQKV
jgi:hypothetical protein